jgi:adenylate kinase family enzyme
VPERVRKIMAEGGLVAAEDYRRIMVPHLSAAEYIGRPMLLSAVGRRIGQERAVIDAAAEADHLIMAIPFIQISEEESFRRLGSYCDRADETPSGHQRRLDEYIINTLPVIEIYQGEGLLLPVDGMNEKDVVYQSLVYTLYDRANGVV